MSKSASKKLYLRPDSKGRVTLGSLAKGISSFTVHQDSDGSLVLEPQVEIPAKEKWLFENKTALSSVRRGLKESAEGKVKSLGSFSKYAKKDED
ncbi:MAG: hypothetical protein SGI74_03550 [Oligoflexia bacterium]|nr:hypothetical protein [Oligoflexia bacterium]